VLVNTIVIENFIEFRITRDIDPKLENPTSLRRIGNPETVLNTNLVPS